MTTVIDASFAVHLQLTADDGLADRSATLAMEGLLAPSLFWLEVANALRSLQLRGIVDDQTRGRALRSLRKLKIELEAAAPEIEQVMSVSDRYQLAIYDAAYLELSIRSGSALATRDKELAAAAARAGVTLVGSHTASIA